MCGRAGERVVRPLGKIHEAWMWLSGGWNRIGDNQTIRVAKVAWYGQSVVWLESLAARRRCAVAAGGWRCYRDSRWLLSPSLGMHLVGVIRVGNVMAVKTSAVRQGGSRHGETHKA